MRSLHFIMAFLVTAAAQAQVSFNGGGYVQDFGSLSGTTNNTLNVPWTDNVTIPGWYSTKTSYSVTDGTLGGSAAAFDSTSETAQNVGLFSFGAAGSADRALGMRSTASFAGNTPIHVGVRPVNNTAQMISRVSFAYTGEQWLKSSKANNTFTLTSTYQLGATSLTSGTWLSTGATSTAPVVSGATATAGDTDGAVAKVEFFSNGTKVGEDTTAPYAFTWTGVPAGSYALIARDVAGNATLSTPVNVTVNSSGTLTRGPYLNQGNDSSIVIRWRSSAAVVGRVRYGTSVALLDQSTDETAATTEHVVKLNGLSAYTRYYYSVGSPTDTLAGGDTGHTFRTSPTPGIATDTRIWVLGDCGRANANQASVRDAYYGWTGSRTPDLCLMLGDNAYNSGTQTEYDAAVFAMYPTFLRKMPLWSCLGNHDANNGSTSPTANFPYFDMFTFPTNGECGGVISGTEHYFSFDYGNIHFINLDSQTSDRATNGPMATWLQADLASTTKTWIVAFFHHPPYSKGSHNSDTETQLIQMRTNFGPILEAGGVDLVLTGHSHSYERSFFLDGHYDVSTTFTNAFKKQSGNGRPAGDGAYLKPLTGPRDHFGAVYTLTGSAGSADGGALNHPAMYVSYNTLGSFNLDINGTRLDATYIEAGGAITDSFTILKQGDADSDGDGIPDAYEIAHGLDRHDPADALLDKDGDGVSNRDEWVLGLLASTPDRYDWTVERSGANVTVTCSTLPGRTYRVWFSSDLATWIPASAAVAGTGGNFVWIDDGTVTGNGSSRFYRVRVTLP